MINQLHLRHFKCFSTLDLPLNRFTLLTGRNSTGKSSVIQSLLSLHQSLVPTTSPATLVLNGDFVRLGSVRDVEDRLTGRGCFSIGVSTGLERLTWEFDSARENEGALFAPLKRSVWHDGDGRESESESGWIPPSSETRGEKIVQGLRELLHVSTERIGPQETYRVDPSFDCDGRLGVRGEFTPSFLLQNSEKLVHPALRIPDAPPQLIRQVSAWLGRFFPGAALDVRRVPNTSLITLHLKSRAEEEFYRPENVGFGLTNILPILVGGLAAAWGRTFIVENPEAHLHPAAQAEMARFLTLVASTEAQIVVESHSDHILNGLRISLRDKVLTPEKVSIHFFEPRDPTSYMPRLISPQADSNGGIECWPQGFFDQVGRDLEALVIWD